MELSQTSPAQKWVPAPGTAGISQRVAAPADSVEDEEEAVLLDVLVSQANLVCYVNEY